MIVNEVASRRGKMHRFSTDLLIRLAARAGLKPKIKLMAKASLVSRWRAYWRVADRRRRHLVGTRQKRVH
jgi:hypothetical protein